MTTNRILPGDIYEDCDYHPVLCTEVDGDDIAGISLIDGTMPRSCSLSHCAVQRMSLEEAIELRDAWDTLITNGQVRQTYIENKFEIITKTSGAAFEAVLQAIYDNPGILPKDNLLLDAFMDIRGTLGFSGEVFSYVIIAYILLRLQRDGLLALNGSQLFLTLEGKQSREKMITELTES